ncbi:MAG: hypothetical protein IK064_04570 [Clostridia bacterium]|nr:hypothetical protein [Clostridia bacterium]MBR6006880.1 hypothetical protein [Clostridia bacterium]
MELDIQAAKEYIAEKFKNQGDFDFISEAEFNEMLDALLELDRAYLIEIGEEEPYDEDVIFDRMHAALSEKHPKLKTYLMRFVDDYMDFMEQYLVSIDAVEWE